jgi:ligand-binding sensor domain-containing protein
MNFPSHRTPYFSFVPTTGLPYRIVFSVMYCLFVCVELSIFSFQALAITHPKNEAPFRYCTRLTQEQGLADNMVHTVVSDRYGFLWFGTRYGLSRYDGNKFTTYNSTPNNKNGLSPISIEALCEGKDGSLWVATDNGGIDRIEPVSGKVRHYTHNSHTSATSIVYTKTVCTDTAGNVWFTTDGAEVTLKKLDIRTGIITQYMHQPANPRSLSSNKVTSVCSDSSGTIWIVTLDAGLNRYDAVNDSFINHNTCPTYALKGIMPPATMSVSADGTLWMMGVKDETLYRVQIFGDSVIAKAYLPSTSNHTSDNSIRCVCVDSKGNIWAGTSGMGLYVLSPSDNGAFTCYTYDASNPYSLPGNKVSKIIEDRYGNIWVCTDGGVAKFHRRNNAIRNIVHSTDGTVFSEVRSLLQESDGTVWIGTSGEGLYRRKNGIYTCLLPEGNSGSNGKTINTILRTKRGELLLGTNDGMYCADIQRMKYKRFDIGTSVKNNRVWALYESPNQELWVGLLRGGAWYFDATRSKKEQLAINAELGEKPSGTSGIFCIYQSADGSIWLGGNNGLYRIDQNTRSIVQHYVKDPTDSNGSLSYNHIWSICENKDGKLWLGTSGGGLTILEPKTGTTQWLTEEQGLINNVVSGIVRDNHNDIWISTIRGLSKYTATEGRFSNFSTNDGVYVSRFHFKSFCKGKNGDLLFGGKGGYVEFHPDSIQLNAQPPNVYITAFRTFNKELIGDTLCFLRKSVVLEYDDNFFTLEFTASDMTNPLANRYRYKLEGVDEEWKEANGMQPNISYTSVQPGNYTFYLQGANSDGIWSIETVSLSVIIRPAWWQTWWFRGSIALLSILGISGLLYWRITERRNKHRTERRIAEFRLHALRARMNPHFIFNTLNSIVGFVLANNGKKAHRYLTKFSRLMRAILEHSSEEYVPLEEEVNILQWYIELEQMRYGGDFSYDITVEKGIDLNADIPAMILQPIAENCIKHGLIHTVKGGYIRIHFAKQNGSMYCTVTDNGIGRQKSESMKAKDEAHISQGLDLVRERLEMLQNMNGGEYSLTTTDAFPDSVHPGTCVTLRFPYSGGHKT